MIDEGYIVLRDLQPKLDNKQNDKYSPKKWTDPSMLA